MGLPAPLLREFWGDGSVLIAGRLWQPIMLRAMGCTLIMVAASGAGIDPTAPPLDAAIFRQWAVPTVGCPANAAMLTCK